MKKRYIKRRIKKRGTAEWDQESEKRDSDTER